MNAIDYNIKEVTITIRLSFNAEALKLFQNKNAVFNYFEEQAFCKHVKDHFKIKIKDLALYEKCKHVLHCILLLLITSYLSYLYYGPTYERQEEGHTMHHWKLAKEGQNKNNRQIAGQQGSYSRCPMHQRRW